VADETLPIARVVLARDVRRILTLPILLGLTGLSAALAGLLLGGTAEIIAVIAGALAIAVAVLLAIVPLSLRMDVEVGGLRMRWFGGSRRFQLARGPVTRVALTGPSAGSIRSRLPVLGWSLGRAVLRGEERIVLVRLARTATVIVVPTDRGRLAIAAAAEGDLLEALGAAARVQQRLDEVGGRVLAAFPEGLAALEEPAAAPAAAEQEVGEGEQRFLTGIERAQLEARLAAAREAALIAAEAERQAALAAAEAAAAEAAATGTAAPRPAAPARRTSLRPNRARERRAATWTRPAWATDARLHTLGTISWALVPLAASLVAWGLAEANQAVAAGDATWSRLLALGLTLGGPAAALGVIAARAWWPKLTGLIAVGAVASLVLTARAAIP
jgi:hypothetical protein